MNYINNRFQGDGTDFWQLWVQYQGYLYQRCLSCMKGNSTDAQEALSRASIKAWEKWLDYAGKIANPRAWLARLTHNLCMDMHRERRREATDIEKIEKIAMAEDKYVAFSAPSPELAVLERERDVCIRDAIDALPANVRIPFMLRYDREMSYSDIAQQLASSNDSVRKRVQQARAILKTQLNKYFSELDNSSRSNTDLNYCFKKGVTSQESWNRDFSLGGQELSHEAMKSAREELVSERIATSDCKTPITAGCTPESIDYKVAATCLEVLSHTWYRSPSCLRWR